jgi:hypothetical protein
MPPEPLPLVEPIELEYAFSIRINFEERLRFESPAGKRVYVPAVSGEIWGPRLQGRVVPRSGADYAGVYGLEAHYMLEASDGALIYIHNTGHLYPKDGSLIPRDDPAWGGGQQEFYFRITPKFDTPKGPHDWMTRTVFVGTGKRGLPDHTVFTYYAVK